MTVSADAVRLRPAANAGVDVVASIPSRHARAPFETSLPIATETRMRFGCMRLPCGLGAQSSAPRCAANG